MFILRVVEKEREGRDRTERTKDGEYRKESKKEVMLVVRFLSVNKSRANNIDFVKGRIV